MEIDRTRPAAFSLVEVVVALGVFAVGIVAVLGFLAPAADGVASNTRAGSAIRIFDAVQCRLREEPFNAVVACLLTAAQLKDQDARPDYDSIEDHRIFFANLSGTKVGRTGDAFWENSHREKFFEIVLVRNDALSPVENEDDTPWIACTVRVRWPLFIATPSGHVRVRPQHGLAFAAVVRR